MEHAKSHARANGIAAPSKKEKKDSEDVDMGNLEEGEEAPGLMEMLANTLYALSKGKGKGKGGYGGKSQGSYKGGGWPPSDAGKGSPKGGKPASLAGGGGKSGARSTFDGVCHHCGKHGHRKNECRALDAEMAKARGLNNVDENGEPLVEEGPKPPPGDEDVWWMGSAYCLTAEKDIRCSPCRAIPVSHRFDALIEEECEEDWREWRSEPTPQESVASKVVAPRQSTHSGPAVQRTKRKYVPFEPPIDLLQDDRAADKGCGEDLELNALGVKTPGAILIEAVVDSGAADPVAKAGTFPGKVVPSSMSKSGRKYRGPDGTRISNEGEQKVQFATDEGHKCGMVWQIADVERPLIAVSHLSAAGNHVTFTKTGGDIVNVVTGKRIKIQRKGGVYVLRMWIPGPQVTAPKPTSAPPFARPARLV
jgi:hypothetical protein